MRLTELVIDQWKEALELYFMSVAISHLKPKWRKKLSTLQTALGQQIVGNFQSAKTAIALLDQKIVNLTVKIDGLVKKFSSGQPLSTADITAISNANADLQNTIANMGTLISGASSSTGESDPTSISVTPNTVAGIVGGTQQLTVTDSDGDDIAAEPSTSYTSDTPGVATVSATGLLSFIAAGSATVGIKDSFGNTTSVGVNVSAPASTVTSITALPNPANLSLSGTTQASLQVVDQNNRVVPATNCTFASADPTVATVDGNGLISAVAEGSTNVTVNGPGGTQTVVAVVVSA